MRVLAGIQTYSIDKFHCEVMINDEALEGFTDQEKWDLSYPMRLAVDALHESIRLLRAKRDQSDVREGVIKQYLYAIKSTGLECSWHKVIDNEYCNGASYWTRPWIIAYSSIGPLKIGWRKRVIVLDWSETPIEETANELFPDEDVTKIDKEIHCWGYDKLYEYLKVLKSAE